MPDREQDLPENASNQQRKMAREDRRTRMEQYGEGHPYTHMPEVDGFGYMVDLFHTSGRALPGFNGPVPLTWQEINHMDVGTAAGMTAWEKMVLMDMSRTFCAWINKGGKQGKVAMDVPYVVNTDESKKAQAERIEQSRKKALDEQAKL